MDARLKIVILIKTPRLEILSILFLLLGFPLIAQDNTEIPYGETVTGNIQAGETQDWQFIGFDGAFISFVVESETELDPIVTLLNQAGEILLQNDDYAYPTVDDALIEGFTLPRTGQYTVSVSGFGQTAGAYQLTILPGFSELQMLDDFRDRVGWEAAILPDYEYPFIDQQEDYLQLELAGTNQLTLAFPTALEALTTYYVQTDVTITTSHNGWVIGIVLGYRNNSNYQMIQVDDEGTWRIVDFRNNEEIVMRNWSRHPAIRVGETAFSLGVLANDSTIDVFYNTAYLGSVSDDLLTVTGRVGLLGGTTNAVGSQTTVQYDNFIVTIPREVESNHVLAESLFVTNDLAKNLERRLVIPAGGVLEFAVNESFIQDRDAGVATLGIGQGTVVTNFVLGARVSWQTSTDGLHGCGLIFRASDEDTAYTLAFIDTNGGYGIAERQDDTFQTIFFAENPLLLDQQSYHLLIIAVDDVLKFYLDGKYITTQENAPVAGIIGNAVLNFEPGTTNCQFRDTWVWNLD